MAKNNLPASDYAKPHGVNMEENKRGSKDPNKYSYDEIDSESPAMDVSIGFKGEKVESEGITIRGVGAATKGTKARGPMA